MGWRGAGGPGGGRGEDKSLYIATCDVDIMTQ